MSTNGRDRFVPLAGGKGVEYTGWQEPLPDLVRRLKGTVQGVKDRLAVPTADVSAWPSAVTGRRIFLPDGKSYDVDVAQTNVGTQAVNYVVATGKTHNISMIFPGPGVFVGRWLKVACYVCNSDTNPVWTIGTLGDVVGVAAALGTAVASGCRPFTTRFSAIDAAVGLNYFWRFQNPRSGRWYPDRPASHMLLMPQASAVRPLGTMDQVIGIPFPFPLSNYLPNGDLFDLKAPWVFERDGQCTFEFRPITDVYQLAGGTSSVLVQVELHGFRFENMQDAVHAGALTQRWNNTDGEDRTG